MKRIKKLVSLLLAMMLVVSMGITAFAEEDTTTPSGANPNTDATSPNGYTITVNGKISGHQYEAYQVFSGKIAEKDGQKVLSDIEWADGVDLTKPHTHTEECYDKKEDVEDRELICKIADGDKLMDALGKAGITVSVGENDEKVEYTITADMSASEVAEVLGKITQNDAKQTQIFADVISKFLSGNKYDLNQPEKVNSDGTYTYQVTVRDPGYYIIKDKDNSLSDEIPDGELEGTLPAYTDFMLQVVGNVEVVSKDTVIKWDKKILVANGYTIEATVDEADIDKVGIGGTETYQLSATVPDTQYYNYYYFVMEDELSEGLDFNNDINVVIKRGSNTIPLVRGTDYTVYEVTADGDMKIEETVSATDTANKRHFKIAIHDIKDEKYHENDEIVATYSATVNENAKVGQEGNTNKYNINYSRNPNYPYPTPDDERPGLPDSTIDMPIGKTPDDIVVTYATKVTIFKTQNDTTTPLAGAEFTLTGLMSEVSLGTETKYVVDDNGTFYQLKALDPNGKVQYTDEVPQTVAEMKPAEADATAGYVIAEDGYSKGDKETVGGVVYRPYNKDTDTGKTVYIKVEPNDSLYVSTTVKFREVTTTETANGKNVDVRFVSYTGISDENGKVIFRDKDGNEATIGTGKFTITETVTPAGFNTIDPLTLVTVATIKRNGEIVTDIKNGNETCDWSVGKGSSADLEVNSDSIIQGGIYNLNIVNNSGSLLPSTGGIGTTIFYVVGGILVVGAGILLVAKKRMSAGK